MHEMALMHDVLKVVLEACEGKPVRAVRKVHLTIGEMRDVVDEYVPGLFRHLARGTIAENAEVTIHHTPLRMQCNRCHNLFGIDVFDESTWVCPHCGARKDYHLFSGGEFRIDSIETEPLGGGKVAAGATVGGERDEQEPALAS